MLVPYESFITRRDQGHRGLPAGVVRRVVGDVLRGLDALHRLCGIVHTDLKAPAATACCDVVYHAICNRYNV